jgi:Gram-negative bacterial TonB protein C-terminal
MNFQKIDRTRRRILGAVQVGANLVLVLLLAACTVTNGQADRGTESILYAPRPLKRIMDPSDFYPDASKRATETGEVILHFRIGADGIAEEPFIVDEAHSTAPRLVKAAQQLFYRSRYEVGESYRHEVTASVLFEIMPCGKLQQTSGLDYYYRLCNPPTRVPEDAPHF